MRRAVKLGSAWCSVCVLVCLSAGSVTAQDPDGDAVRLFGATRLSPPEGAANEEARGFAFLRESGERQAIHVHVRHLEPGATYDVVASREVEGPATETADLGTITTREDTPPPPPRCYDARLQPPAEEEPEGEDPADGGGAHFGHRDSGPSGHATLVLNSERTEVSYRLYVRGLTGAVTAAAVKVGDDVILTLELDEELSGSAEISEEQLNAVASGEASVIVKTDADEELSGVLKPCFSFLQHLRERFWKLRVGSGALRLDTERGDTMPFGVASVEELEGVTIAVEDADGNVVLTGTIDEIWAIEIRHRWGQDGDANGGGGALEEDSEFGEVDEYSFDVSEPHDASFVRGDANDDSIFNLTDAISVLSYLFQAGPSPYCRDASDANDDGTVDISDPVLMLFHLFQGHGALDAPSPERGFDPTADGLFCEGIGT